MCKLCAKLFTQSGSLTTHMETHKEEKHTCVIYAVKLLELETLSM